MANVVTIYIHTGYIHLSVLILLFGILFLPIMTPPIIIIHVTQHGYQPVKNKIKVFVRIYESICRHP